MQVTRRDFMSMAGASLVAAVIPACASVTGTRNMYGLIGRMKVVPGERDALIEILLEGVSGMAGCLSYVVVEDPTDSGAMWVTEVWESQDEFGERFATKPVGGHGLQPHG